MRQALLAVRKTLAFLVSYRPLAFLAPQLWLPRRKTSARSPNKMAAAVELAAERDRLAALKLKKQALEQQLAAAAARDADACAAAARAMRAAVAATPLSLIHI